MSKPKVQNARGTRDFGPAEAQRRQYIQHTIRGVFEKYGYQPLETPALENLETLTGKYGEEGDQLLFRILNSGDFLKDVPENLRADARKLSPAIAEKALRYDLTVPFARYVAMNHGTLALPFKRYQMQPVWRADRPQKGRYREFIQCDIDVVGTDSLLMEAEFLAIYDEAFSKLGLTDFSIKLNHRKVLEGMADAAGALHRFVDICTAIDKLDKIGLDGVAKDLEQRGLGAEVFAKLLPFLEHPIIKDSQGLESLYAMLDQSETGRQGISELKEILGYYAYMPQFGGKLEIDLRLARGLAYYTGAIFEVKVNNVAMGSLGGGGRYDNLTALFGVNGLSGAGISFGADRIYDVLDELNLFPESLGQAAQLLMVQFPNAPATDTAYVLEAASWLRRQGFRVEVYPSPAKLAKQMSYADRKNIAFVALAGSDEIAAEEFTLKNLKTGQQQRCSLASMAQLLSA